MIYVAIGEPVALEVRSLTTLMTLFLSEKSQGNVLAR